MGRWSRSPSGNTPGPGTERDPAGVRQDSPGRKPWEPWRAWMSALTGRCRRLRPFQAGILGAHVARARALAFAARPVQGRSLGVSPSAKMCAFSQGLRPGLSCATLSGSSAFSIRVSSWQASETSDERHRSWVAADCRPSAPHQGFTGTRQAVHCHSVTCGRQPAALRGRLQSCLPDVVV